VAAAAADVDTELTAGADILAGKIRRAEEGGGA